MTEPVAVAASTRRTVRVAVALVTGQALLCAVIGWLTFGPEAADQAPARPVDVLAGPPLAMPTASVALPPVATPTSRPPSSRPAPARTSPRTPAAAPTTTRAAPPPEPIEAPTTVAAPPPVPPKPPNPDLVATPGTTPDADEVQKPVVPGEPCDPEGARGETADGVALRCVRADGGRLVWQVV